MSDVNPYAAPLAASVFDAEVVQSEGPQAGIWREANTLVMWKDAQLPDRCVRCNAPTNGRRLRRTLYWHHPLLWLIALASPLLYIIVALIVRKKAVVSVGICDDHHARRVNCIVACCLIMLACAGMLWYGIRAKSDTFVLASIILFFGNLCFAAAISRLVVPTRIDDHYVWIRKIHPDYLAQFPWLPK